MTCLLIVDHLLNKCGRHSPVRRLLWVRESFCNLKRFFGRLCGLSGINPGPWGPADSLIPDWLLGFETRNTYRYRYHRTLHFVRLAAFCSYFVKSDRRSISRFTSSSFFAFGCSYAFKDPAQLDSSVLEKCRTRKVFVEVQNGTSSNGLNVITFPSGALFRLIKMKTCATRDTI